MGGGGGRKEVTWLNADRRDGVDMQDQTTPPFSLVQSFNRYIYKPDLWLIDSGSISQMSGL